jgi:hypothetical protein
MMRFDEEQSLDRVAASRTVEPSLAIAIACSPSAPLRQSEGLHEGRISGSS